MGRRIRWLGLVLIVCFALVLLQLVNIQVRKASSLNASAENPRNLAKQYDNDRGTIRAANGTVLARSVKIAHPTSYQYRRTYPTGTLFAGIVGFWSEFRGTAGVEYKYNTELVPHQQAAATLGQLLSPPPATPDDVTLTVQPHLQQVVKTALAGLPGPNKDAAVVVTNPKGGTVLAMYSSPSFDPNTLATPLKDEAASKADFTTPDAEGFLPGQPMATWYPFLPGSTFKVVTSAAAYHLKPTLATFSFPVAKCTTPGTLPTTLKICNDIDTPGGGEACGGKMTQMLPVSCDPGYATLGNRLGATVLSEQAEDFGYNAKPPIDLPQSGTNATVQESVFPSVEDFQKNPGGVPLAAFGQGTVSATALQGAMVAEGIADTGTVMTPHVMAQIRDSQGRVVQTYKPTAYKQAVTAASAKKINVLMQGVVTTPAGTAHNVGFTPDDHVAVKTGTAQLGTAKNTETNDWMIGFAPATDPTVAVAVVVPYRGKTDSGATIAGPVFRKVIEAALAEQRAHSPATTTTTTTTSSTVPRRTPASSGTTTTAPLSTTTTTAPVSTTTTLPPTTTTTTTVPATTTTVATAATPGPPTAGTP